MGLKVIVFDHERVFLFDKITKLKIDQPLYIKGWANCLREGQNLNWHEHGA